ncbi:MAG: hypothetical protein AABX38_03595 [Candidatus Micrarchaeota archaeon]
MLEILSKYKKIFYYSAIGISAIGMLLAVVSLLIMLFAISEVENLTQKQLDTAIDLTQDMQNLLTNTSDSLNNATKSFDSAQGTLSLMRNATKSMGSAFTGLADTLSSLPLGSFANAASDLKAAGSQMSETSNSIKKLESSVENNKQSVKTIAEDINTIKSTLSSEEDKIIEMKASLGNFFLALKIVSVMGSFSIGLMFLVLILIAAPQLK